MVIDWINGGDTSSTENDCVSLNGGEALSVTRTEMKLLLPGKERAGIQVNRPFVGFTAAPLGAPASRLNVNTCGGESKSKTEFVKLTSFNGYVVRLAMA